MPLKGNFATMALPDLLQWLGAAQKTGVLTLSQGGITKRITFDNGFISGSFSDHPSEFLGQFLLSYGRITEAQLRDALEDKQSSSELLGERLVRTGAITSGDLSRMLGLKTEETIYSLFGWDEGQFEYEDCQPQQSPFPVALRIDDILLKGARRFDEVARIREVISSAAAIPRRTSKPLPAEIPKSPNLNRLAEAIDGTRSIAAIALQAHTSEFLVSKFIFEGLRNGLFELSTEPAPEKPPASDDLVSAVRRLFDAGDYEAVLTLVDRKALKEDDPMLPLIRQCERKFVERMLEGPLAPDRIPAVRVSPSDLMAEQLSPEEYFLISRMDGSWNVQSILAIAPLRETDALYVLSRLHKRGLISVHDPSAVTT